MVSLPGCGSLEQHMLNEMSYPVFLLLLCASVGNSLWHSALNVMYATNRHKTIATIYLLVYALTLIASYFVAQRYGIIATSALLLNAELILTFFVLPKALLLTNDSWLGFLNTIIRPPTFLIKLLANKPI